MNYSDLAGQSLEFGIDASEYATLFTDNNIQSIAVDKADVKMGIPVTFLSGKDYVLFSMMKDNTAYPNAITLYMNFQLTEGQYPNLVILLLP